MDRYAVALLLYMSIVLYGQSILMGVIEEKSQRVAEVVVAAVPADTLLRGNKIDRPVSAMVQKRKEAAAEKEELHKRPSILPPLGTKKDPSPEPA